MYDKLFERVESSFTNALEKICKQQREIYTDKIKTLEDNFQKTLDNTNKNFEKMLDSFSNKYKDNSVNDGKLKNRIHTLEQENFTLKSSLQENRSESTLKEESMKSELIHQKSLADLQKKAYEKTVRDLQNDVDKLSSKLEIAESELITVKSSRANISDELDKKEREILNLRAKSVSSENLLGDFEEVTHTKRKTVRQKITKPHIVLIGTSNIRKIDPDQLSSKFTTEKHIAYTIQEAEKEALSLENAPEVIVLHSLTNDVENQDNSDSLNQLESAINKIQQKFEDTEVIISLPTPRADDEAINDKAQILSLMIKDKLRNAEKIHLCNNSNMSYKGKALMKFLEPRDKKHLTDSGVSVLAANIRDTVDNVLGIRHRLTNQNNMNQRRQFRRGQSEMSQSEPFDYNLKPDYRGRGTFRRGRGRRPYNRGYRGGYY